MSSFRLVLRALVTGPARTRPIRAFLPVVGVAVGVGCIRGAGVIGAGVTLGALTTFRTARLRR